MVITSTAMDNMRLFLLYWVILLTMSSKIRYPFKEGEFPPLPLSGQLVDQIDNGCDKLDNDRNQDDDFARVVLVAVFPVSYTHLTLPTN